MQIIQEINDLENFQAWSDAIGTKRKICDAGKGANFIVELDIMYPTGITETALNDLLWHESEFCLALVGLKDE